MDTLKVQMGLERLGFMEPRDGDIYVSTDSDQLFGAMKDFQKANGLEVDGIANPDGPTHRAMNKALSASAAHRPATPLITRPIPAAGAAVRHKNERDIRVLGRRSDPGDFPVLMAQTLLSRNGEAAAPEVADLLGQIYARNPDMGRKARIELAGVMDETSMRHIDDAAKIPPGDREPPQRPIDPEPEPPTLESAEAQNDTNTLPPPGDRPVDPDVLKQILEYEDEGHGDIANAVSSPIDSFRVGDTISESRAQAEAVAQKRHLNGLEKDAFRHVYWSYRMAQEAGVEVSKQFGDAHERTALGIYEGKRNSNPDGEKLMDLYNNRVGRELFQEHPQATPDQITEIILDAMSSGRIQLRNFSIKRGP